MGKIIYHILNFLHSMSPNLIIFMFCLIFVLQAVFSRLECLSQPSADKVDQPYMTKIWPLAKESGYIKACISSLCHLSWNMVIQRPPMRFTADGIGEKWQGEKTQELWWNSCDPKSKGAKVKCYVYPALWHRGKVLSAGRVLVQKLLI